MTGTDPTPGSSPGSTDNPTDNPTDSPTDSEVVLVEVAERVATVTLNRPDQRNALNRAVQRRLPRVIAELDADDARRRHHPHRRRPRLLRRGRPQGAGGASGSPDAAEGRDPAELVLPRATGGPLPPRAKPIIGAINGVAVTGGLELALACDFLVASDRARFADTHARVGVMPGWGLTVLLPEAIGVRRAREMSLTGNYIDAELAADWGLVNHVITHRDLLGFCHRMAADIVSNDPDGVRQMLDTYRRGGATTAAEAWEIEAEVSRSWAAERLDPASVEARRQAILARGRSQQG